jgi:hypothetical protein
MFVCFRAAEKSINHKPTTLPIDLSTLVKDRWHKHPRLPVQVNEAGTHIYNNDSKTCIRINRVQKKYSHGLNWRFNFEEKNYEYSRVALECFTKQLLVGEMTVDHEDCNRDNNCMANLSAKGHLFQVNYKKIQRFPVEGKVVGVVRCTGKDGKHPGWKATVAEIMIDIGVTRTYPISHVWSDSVHGYEGGFQKAVAFRQKHTPREHMIGIDNSSSKRSRSNSIGNHNHNSSSKRSRSNSIVIVDEVPSSTL